MAMPTSIENPERKVRDAVGALGSANKELGIARNSKDKDKIEKAQGEFNSKASALKVAAKALEDAAGRL